MKKSYITQHDILFYQCWAVFTDKIQPTLLIFLLACYMSALFYVDINRGNFVNLALSCFFVAYFCRFKFFLLNDPMLKKHALLFEHLPLPKNAEQWDIMRAFFTYTTQGKEGSELDFHLNAVAQFPEDKIAFILTLMKTYIKDKKIKIAIDYTTLEHIERISFIENQNHSIIEMFRKNKCTILDEHNSDELLATLRFELYFRGEYALTELLFDNAKGINEALDKQYFEQFTVPYPKEIVEHGVLQYISFFNGKERKHLVENRQELLVNKICNDKDIALLTHYTDQGVIELLQHASKSTVKEKLLSKLS